MPVTAAEWIRPSLKTAEPTLLNRDTVRPSSRLSDVDPIRPGASPYGPLDREGGPQRRRARTKTPKNSSARASTSRPPAHFSDGVTEDLITGLSKVSRVFVITRNSVFTYKGKAVKVGDVGRDLGVRYVPEGGVQRAGCRVRITAQLVDTTTGYHIWAERYDREVRDVFALQDEVTQQIIRALAVKLTAAEQGQMGRAPTGNPDAYNLVLRGQEKRRRTTREANMGARRFLVKAMDLDPQYGRAYVELSWAHLQSWQFG